MVYGIHNLTNKDGGARQPPRKHHPRPVFKPPVVVEVQTPVEIVKTPEPVKPVRVAKSVMTAQEVGDWLGVGRHYIIKIARRGELVGEQIKRDWQFKLSDVEDYIERCKYQTQQQIKLKQLAKK
jgi:excisionase family DNA binding protein